MCRDKNPRLLQVSIICLTLAGLIAMFLKAWLLWFDLVPFNSDEAVVALMAEHILQGQMPLFFYGQAYMGSLDAYLIAAIFKLFGPSVWGVRLIQSLLYLGVLITTALLTYMGYRSWWVAVIAVFLLAIPTVNTTLYTTVSLGGYGEALLIGNFIFITTLSIQKDWHRQRFPGEYFKWAVFGFLSGIGLWSFGISLVFSLAALMYLTVYWIMALSSLLRIGERELGSWQPRVRKIALAGLIFLLFAFLGSFPWWFYAHQAGLKQLIWELGGGAIAGIEQTPWLTQIWQHAVNLFLFGFTATLGFRPPWSVAWLALPLIPVVILIWVTVIFIVLREFFTRESGEVIFPQQPEASSKWINGLLMLTIVILMAAFILSPFGADPSGRYFVPLVVPLAVLAAWSLEQLRSKFKRLSYGLLGVILFFNLWGTVQCARNDPPGFTTQFYAPTQIDHRYDQELIDFLYLHDEKYGYTNYWVAYPLAFHSSENLIYVPALPYHMDFRYTQRDNRYQPYQEQVQLAKKVAYITTHHPALNDLLRYEFRKHDISWHEATIGDFQVFYHLSALITPQEMGLGITTQP